MAVLNDVLDFSKMENDRLEIHACDFDFESLAQSTLDLFFNAASLKGLLITLALDPGSSPKRRRFYDNADLTDFMTKPIDGNALGERLAEIAAMEVTESHDVAFDQEHLARLRAALGPTRLRSLLDLFATELNHRPDQLCDHLLAGRLDQAKWEAHNLKGAALSVGATELGTAAMAVEQLTAADNIKVNARLIDQLEKAATAARTALGRPALDGGRASATNA